MRIRNFAIGPEAYGEILQECVKARNLPLGQQIHGLVAKKGNRYTVNSYIQTKLVVFYSKCGSLDDAETSFRRLKAKNVYSCAAIIGARVKNRLNKEALLGLCEMVEDGIVADNYVLPNVLKACAELHLVQFGRAVHGYANKLGYTRCVYVSSSLLDMYSKCGSLIDARKMFDIIPNRNTVSWNAMLSCFVQNGLDDEAVRTFYRMRMEDVEPTRATFVNFLSSCSSLGAIEEGKQGHALIILHGLELDSVLGSAVVNLYSKGANVEDAEMVFRWTYKRDTVIYNVLLWCYNQHKKYEEILLACYLMGSERVDFDSLTVNCLLFACGELGCLRVGKEVHCFCIRNYMDADKAVAVRLVEMYGKFERIQDARKVFCNSSTSDGMLWNSLLAVYEEII